MDFAQILILALLQGVTEFLPISSSAHLILAPVVSDWEDQGLGFDLAVHLGTLVAVVVYFRHDLRRLASDWARSVLTRERTGDSRLAWAILWGTAPTGLAGLIFHDWIEAELRSAPVIMVTTILFGLLLGWAYLHCRGSSDEASISIKTALIIGCAQALALIPGTSRSGITITAALILGLAPTSAARFSFLLAIPITALAILLQAWELLTSDQSVAWGAFALAAAISAAAAFLCIHYFLAWLTRWGLMPYVAYRLLLGAGLAALVW